MIIGRKGAWKIYLKIKRFELTIKPIAYNIKQIKVKGVCMGKEIETFDFNYWKKGTVRHNLCTGCKKTIDEILDHNKEYMSMELRVYHVDSQPGDATHYSYFVYRDGYDSFNFMPKDNTFKYPQKLSYWDVKDLDVRVPQEMSGSRDVQQEIIDLAIKHDYNPYTIKECVRTIIELYEEKRNEKN